MELGWKVHFEEIVIPAWQAYRAAEKSLSDAVKSGDDDAIFIAHRTALREGGAAVIYLHHYLEIVVAGQPEWLPEITGLRMAKDWLGTHCTQLRSATPSDDVSLLCDVADALKHSRLRNENRNVSARGQVLVVQTGYAELPFSEGKFGGTAQVIIVAKTGKRALSTVLQNVIDAWRRAGGWNLPAIGKAY